MRPEIETLGTVVVCEDDETTRALLTENLAADRFTVLEAADASEALHHCRWGQPNLLLLDLGLPDYSGLDVLRRIRGSFGPAAELDATLPVLILSGSAAETQRVRGLEAGANDYLVKPFSYPELLLRMRNLLAQRRAERSGPIRVGALTLDPATRQVSVGDRPVALANKEYELLLRLAAEPTAVHSKRDLLRDVWGYRLEARTRTLDSHASRLRRKLDPEHGSFVINCWGVGYRLVEG